MCSQGSSDQPPINEEVPVGLVVNSFEPLMMVRKNLPTSEFCPKALSATKKGNDKVGKYANPTAKDTISTRVYKAYIEVRRHERESLQSIRTSLKHNGHPTDTNQPPSTTHRGQLPAPSPFYPLEGAWRSAANQGPKSTLFK